MNKLIAKIVRDLKKLRIQPQKFYYSKRKPYLIGKGTLLPNKYLFYNTEERFNYFTDKDF